MYNVSNKLENQTEYYTMKVSGSRAEFGPNVSHKTVLVSVTGVTTELLKFANSRDQQKIQQG